MATTPPANVVAMLEGSSVLSARFSNNEISALSFQWLALQHSHEWRNASLDGHRLRQDTPYEREAWDRDPVQYVCILDSQCIMLKVLFPLVQLYREQLFAAAHS